MNGKMLPCWTGTTALDSAETFYNYMARKWHGTLPLLTVNDEVGVFNSNAPPNQVTTEAVYRGGRVETQLETIAAGAVLWP